MIYLLDTNAVSRYLSDRPSRIEVRVAELSKSEVATCSIVEAELRFGLAKAGASQKRYARLDGFLQGVWIYDFDSAAAREYGRLRARLEANGEVIGGNDLMIAAIALAHDLTLVTHNMGEFARVTGLRVEDWE
ncbi:type II toxin-antitoxin system VapC family toxin [bacterium]|nr:MAG: type II toxin-antitoxin system VapC family toxin [bacterium]